MTPVLKYDRIKLCVTAVLALGFPQVSAALDDDLLDLTLDKLTQMKVSIASKTETSLRESPGIVTVITAKEIANLGARDLIDVLRLVPGFQFGVDVNNAVGMGIRGNWAHEGKFLLLMDGVELNENAFGSTQFGLHYPVDQIQRIEIIRGPGSVLYGGFAELGVINIISKNATDLHGGQLSAAYGKMQNAVGLRQVNLNAGDNLNSGVNVSALLYGANGHRSDESYTDFAGTTFDMAGNNNLESQFANLTIGYKGLQARAIIDRYHLTTADRGGMVVTDNETNEFDNYLYSLDYTSQLGDKWKLSSNLQNAQRSSWKRTIDGVLDNQNLTTHWKGSVGMSYVQSDSLTLTLGGEYTRDSFEYRSDTDPPAHYERGPQHSYALLVEVADRSPILGNITLGLRFEDHSEYGSKFAPRAALTKVLGDFHYKVLYSYSYRTPTLGNFDLNPNIRPETTRGLELEAGYLFSNHLVVTANAFNLVTRDSILFGQDPSTNSEQYFNANRFGTQGVEMDVRVQHDWGYVSLGYSYYRTTKNDLAEFQVTNFQTGETQQGTSLGFAAHSASLNAHVRLSPHFSANPSMNWYGPRYAYTSQDSNGDPVLDKLGGVVLANLNFRYEDLFEKRITLNFGAFNILDKRADFVQPYNGGHAPLAGPSREWVLKGEYRF
jgi:outer membrane receptor for ferrienterochelin and colicin